MARIITKVGLLSLVILWQVSVTPPPSILANSIELPITVEETTTIPESEQVRYLDQAELTWDRLLNPACCIGYRNPSIYRNALIETADIATCPAESQSVDQSCSIDELKADSAILDIGWSLASSFIEEQKVLFNCILDIVKESRQAVEREIVDFAIESTDWETWSHIHGSSEKSLRKLIPVVLISSKRSGAFIHPSSTESIETDGNEPESENETLIRLPENSQGSYWQYYEDCDRWGVDFSSLLLEAQQHWVESLSETEQIAETGTQIQSISPNVAFARLIVSQNLSTWLYPSLRIDGRSSAMFNQLLDLIEVNVVKGSQTNYLSMRRVSEPDAVEVAKVEIVEVDSQRMHFDIASRLQILIHRLVQFTGLDDEFGQYNVSVLKSMFKKLDFITGHKLPLESQIH